MPPQTAFRDDRARHSFLPIDEVAELREHERISRAIAAAAAFAAAGAGPATAYNTSGRRNPVAKWGGAGSDEVVASVTKAATKASGGYAYEWQKPPLFKAVMQARLNRLRSSDLLANNGVLLAECAYRQQQRTLCGRSITFAGCRL